jgi:hypothetical protein
MRTIVDDTLRQEAARYRLRFGCEHCAHFASERRACAEGFPNGPHLDVNVETTAALEFCKSFELL